MAYEVINAKGSDTATPLNLRKRLAVFDKYGVALANQKVIDCGCGTGEYVVEFLKLGADAYGVEYFAEKVADFRQKYPENEHRLQQGDIEAMDFPANSFDVALLNEVLEHVPNDQNALLEICRILKPGGFVVIFSPNRYYPFESHGVYLKLAGRWLPIYVPFIPWIPLALGKHLFRYWARNYWPHELQAVVKAAGFQITHTDFLWQTFENVSRRQPLLIRTLRQPMRALATAMEKSPLKNFGISQVVIARKPL